MCMRVCIVCMKNQGIYWEEIYETNEVHVSLVLGDFFNHYLRRDG